MLKMTDIAKTLPNWDLLPVFAFDSSIFVEDILPHFPSLTTEG